MTRCWLSFLYPGSLLALWLVSTSLCSSSEKEEDMQTHGNVFEEQEVTRAFEGDLIFVQQGYGQKYLNEYCLYEEAGLTF